MTPYEQALRYVHAIPGAVSGNRGHDQTFSVATALAHGFQLNFGDAMAILKWWNGTCSPPWTDAELTHKLATAMEATNHGKPRGHLLSGSGSGPSNRPRPASSTVMPIAAPQTVVKPADYLTTTSDREPIPPGLPDPTRALLHAAFEPGEGVRIVPARLNDDGREVPAGDGPTLSCTEWISRLNEADGDPNGIFSSSDRTGIYIAINPLKIGGNKDADVTALRHTLLEFDGISPEEQWNLYRKSNVPCTAIIHSGGKSVHAWVRIDAKDRTEYDERVGLLYAHFGALGIDNKNKNPSRLSRLPGCIRFDKRQELLAVSCGAESFTQWISDKIADGIGERLEVQALLDFDPSDDSNSLIGNRWACRGGSILFVGQSGIGKSSMEMQLAVTWALGRPAFGITPKRPLKSMIIQAENDLGDTAEMFNGVLNGLGIDRWGDDMDVIRSSVVIVRESTHTGEAFTKSVRRLIDRHQPDLVWLDPLLSFIGDDISDQRVCGQFLRNWLNPISQATGVCWMMMHHTGKPPTEKGARADWKSNDFSYYGIGSSELTNWARGVVVLRGLGDGEFQMILAKRGPRAGARTLTGEPTTDICLKYGSHGIYWEQTDPGPDDDIEPGKGRPTKADRLRNCGLGPFLDAIPLTGESKNDMAKRLARFAGKLPKGKRVLAQRSTCMEVIDALFEDTVISLNDDGKMIRGTGVLAVTTPTPEEPQEDWD